MITLTALLFPPALFIADGTSVHLENSQINSQINSLLIWKNKLTQLGWRTLCIGGTPQLSALHERACRARASCRAYSQARSPYRAPARSCVPRTNEYLLLSKSGALHSGNKSGQRPRCCHLCTYPSEGGGGFRAWNYTESFSGLPLNSWRAEEILRTNIPSLCVGRNLTPNSEISWLNYFCAG